MKMLERKTPTILLVNDSDLVLEKLERFLKKDNYKILTASNGIEAVDRYHLDKPDVIIMDTTMPVMDGIKATKKILEVAENPNMVKIIMSLSLETDPSVAELFKAGAYDYILKPIDYNVLRRQIRQAIDSQHAMIDLSKTLAFTQSIISSSSDCIITAEENGEIIYLNPTAMNLIDFESNEGTYHTIYTLLHKFFEESAEPIAILDLLNNNYETSLISQNGSYIPIEFSVSQFDALDKSYFNFFLRDITQRKKYEMKMTSQTFYDELTGLPNSVLLKERFMIEINRVKRSKKKLAVLHINVDNFRMVNDSLGNNFGDDALKTISARIMKSIRKDDFIARVQGDQFVLLLPGFDNTEHVGKIASNILRNVSNKFRLNNQDTTLTCSIGISICPDNGESQELLTRNADIALQRAKDSGRNNFNTFTAELNEKALARITIEKELQSAVKNKELILYYQPKVNSLTEEIIGMEALVRWNSPKLGFLMPNDFIHIAEESGAIHDIGQWVLRQACIDNKLLQEEGYRPLTVSVNLSARQFTNENFIETTLKILLETLLKPKYLELEISEHIAMIDITNTIDIIATLRQIGVHFSIDDIGTGFTSLKELGKISVDSYKIDRSLLENIEYDSKRSDTASMILAFGESLDRQIIAKGVENIEQIDFLEGNNCTEMQGYFFSKPVLLDEFKVLLDKQNNQDLHKTN